MGLGPIFVVFDILKVICLVLQINLQVHVVSYHILLEQ